MKHQHADEAAAPPGGGPSDRNIRAIAALENEAQRQRTRADRLSDAVARVTGSGWFAILNFVFFGLWVALNLGFGDLRPFDPFPFNFLTLVVSLEAIFLSVFVLMVQNRMTRAADKRAHLNLQIDLLAEQELTAMLRMLQALCAAHGVEVAVPAEQVRQLGRETDPSAIAASLRDHLPGDA